MRTDEPLTATEFEHRYGEFPCDVNAVAIKGSAVERNGPAPLFPPQQKREAAPVVERPTRKDLDALWAQYPDGHIVRRAIYELRRVQGRLGEAEKLRHTIQKVFAEEVGGELVAMYQLRRLLQDETRNAGW